MNPILVTIGPIHIYWYSIFLFVAFYLGGTLAIREAKKWKLEEDFMINLFFYLIPASLIGARFYFVMFHLDFYSKNIIEIFKVWEGGLAIHGGIIAGLLCIFVYAKKYKAQVLRITDILVVSLILGQAIGRWGNFFNSEAFGPATTLSFLESIHIPKFIIDGMYIEGIYYQPTFFYESVWCLLGVFVLYFIRKYRYIKLGQTTCAYMIWYGIGRFFIESLRQDSLMFGELKMAQIASIAMIVIGIVGYFVIRKKSSVFSNNYHDRENVNEIRF